MFSRKKKKNTAEGQADLAKKLGISLLGEPDLHEDDGGGDDALEEELLALMEEEAAAQAPKTSGRPNSESDDVDHDEQLLAELAVIESGGTPSQTAARSPSRGAHPSPPSETLVVKPKPPVPQPRTRESPTKQLPAPMVPPREDRTPTPPKVPARSPESGHHGHVSQSPDRSGVRAMGTTPGAASVEGHQPREVPQEAVSSQGSAGVLHLPQHRDPDKIVASVPKQPADRYDTVTLIEGRIRNYESALANARASQQDSKARRYERGLKTLKDLQRKAKAGKAIPDGDLPPEVAAGGSMTTDDAGTAEAAAVTPVTTQLKTPDEHTHKLLCQRRDLYKMAALQSKKAGDPQTAMEYLKVTKQFEQVIAAAEAGQEIDLSNMPPPPSELKKTPGAPPQTVLSQTDRPPAQETAPPVATGMASPKTVLEALLQRRERYRSMADRATAESNSSKARRLGRIVKQYEEAIKKEKSGRPVEYNELPELPDFPPLPLKQGHGGSAPTQEGQAAPPVRAPDQMSPQKPVATLRPQPSPRATPPTDGATQPSPPRKSVKESMNERQLKVLLERQKKVKLQALEAKKQGDTEEAKRLIIIARGFDPMIEAAKNGMPVNMDSIPKIPDESVPQSVSPPPVIDAPMDAQLLTGDKNEMYQRLITTLQKQIEQCQTLAEAYQELGNAPTSRRFQEYWQASQEDKDVLTMAQQHNDPVPRFHFEQRTIPTLRITPGLKKEEAEITILRGSNYKHQGDKEEEVDTYVKYEFQYPSDKPQVGQTGAARGAETVEYGYTCKVQVNLKARSFLSFVKRKSIKFEVLQKRGFLKGEKSLGTASMKLAELENKHEIEGSFPLCEGRKEIGGTLEARVRLHHPVSGMKEEFVKEKWLVVESKVGRGLGKTSPTKLSTSPSKPVKPGSSPTKAANTKALSAQVPDTIDVLKFEIMQLKKKNDQLVAMGKPRSADINATMQSHMQTIKGLEGMLKNTKTRQAYIARLQSNSGLLTELAKRAQQQGNREKVKLLLTKKQLVGNELDKLSGRR